MAISKKERKARSIKLATSKLNKWIAFGKLTGLTGFAQVIVQAIAFACGILVIRVLPTEEYALYTLANTMLGTMIILADGGISAGVMAEGGKVWNSRTQLGTVIATGIHLRKRFAIFSLLIAVPVLLYLLQHHGAGWLSSTLIILALIPAFWSALSGTILEIVPKLNQDVVSLQKIQIFSNLGRLGLLGLSIFIFPWAYVAILMAGIAQIWANLQIRNCSKKFIDHHQTQTKAVEERVLKIVKRTMPSAIYYAISGQIMIWLISFFGNTENIAQIGALTRLATLLIVIQSIFSLLVIPYFAKIQNDKNTIVRSFLLVQILLLGITALVTLLTWTFPDLILSTLGEQYNDLSLELILMIIASCVALQGGIIYHISSSMGIVPQPFWIILYMLIIQIALIFAFDLSQVSQVILYSIGINIATLLYQSIYFLRSVYARP